MCVCGEVVSGLVRDVDIAVDRDVGDGIRVACEELAAAEVLVEQPQHLEAVLSAPRRVLAVRIQPSGDEAKTQAADRGDHVGLLVDEPAHDLRAVERIVRQERRPVGEVEEDRRGLRHEPAVDRLEHRRRPRRIHLCVRIGERLAREDVDRDRLVVRAELSE